MQRKKKISIIVAIVAVLAIAATGFMFFKGESNDTNESPTVPKAMETSMPENSEAIEKAEDSKVPEEEIQKQVDETREFDDAKEIANFSKEEVQEVLRSATKFTYNGMTNSYFLSGQWVEDGMPNVIEPVVGQYFTKEIREEIKAFDTNPETGENIDVKVYPMMMYFFPNEVVGTSELCDVYENAERPSCIISGPEFTTMSYTPTMTGEEPGVNVKYSATIRIPVTLNGEDAFVDIRNDYDLNFILNDSYDEESNPQKYVINHYQVQSNIGAVTAL